MLSKNWRFWISLIAQAGSSVCLGFSVDQGQPSRSQNLSAREWSERFSLTLTTVFVIQSTSFKGTLKTVSSISSTVLNILVKNDLKHGRYGSRSLGWRTVFFGPSESISRVGARPLPKPSRTRIPGVRMPSSNKSAPDRNMVRYYHLMKYDQPPWREHPSTSWRR